MTGPFDGAGVVCDVAFAQRPDSCERPDVRGLPDTAGMGDRSAPGIAYPLAPSASAERSFAYPRSRKSITGAVIASAVLHALLLIALSGLVGRAPVRLPGPAALDVRLVTQTSPLPEAPALAPVPLPEPAPPPEPRVASPRLAIPAAPQLTPKPIAPPALARAIVNVEVDGPVDDVFATALSSTSAGLPRVALEFAEPLYIEAPERVLRDATQRRVRGLVRVHDTAQVELLVVDEYDDDLILAIRDALDRTQARAPGDGTPVTPGWAIVVFWFERVPR